MAGLALLGCRVDTPHVFKSGVEWSGDVRPKCTKIARFLDLKKSIDKDNFLPKRLGDAAGRAIIKAGSYASSSVVIYVLTIVLRLKGKLNREFLRYISNAQNFRTILRSIYIYLRRKTF